MVLKDILAISGESGLYRFIAQGKNSIIVEHLETKKRIAAHGTAKVSSLEDISIFTEEEDVPLSRVFDLIFEKENGGPAISHKAAGPELSAYFGEVLPSYDRDRVYSSDIKKLFHWYNILQQLDLLVKEEPEKAEEAKEPDAVGEPVAEKAKSRKPAEKKDKPAKGKGTGK
ncbi:MAG: DUF5606 domain-containing protein [Bacteroidales bacterium]